MEDPSKKGVSAMLFIYLGISGFLGLFTTIYYQFSHGVTSPFMTFVFLIPLVGGCGSVLLKRRLGEGNVLSHNAYPAGLAALIMACLLHAVFDIAGNSSVYVPPLFVMGIGLTLVGVVSYFAGKVSRRARG
jgi:hypothetical protein